ncbi:MAG: RNA-binding S4 domain-containing protein [Verrucomicrobia bacterium]|nr:RNA-binding S4 domain-containing protein [Verrucomicrobiota bacterium]
MKDIEIAQEPIELYKLLKLAGIASSGGEAKWVVEESLVSVNGALETRKRKKIVSGDVIACRGATFQVRLLSD